MDIILKVYWAGAKAREGQRGCPNCAGRLGWEKRSFLRVEGKKRGRHSSLPPPHPKAGLSVALSPSVRSCKLFTHARPTDLLSSLSSPAPPPGHQQHWRIWGSLRHSFRLHKQPAREWRSVICERETSRLVDWAPNREVFLFVHLHLPLRVLFCSQSHSHCCKHERQLQTDLSWDYFLADGSQDNRPFYCRWLETNFGRYSLGCSCFCAFGLLVGQSFYMQQNMWKYYKYVIYLYN